MPSSTASCSDMFEHALQQSNVSRCNTSLICLKNNIQVKQVQDKSLALATALQIGETMNEAIQVVEAATQAGSFQHGLNQSGCAQKVAEGLGEALRCHHASARFLHSCPFSNTCRRRIHRPRSGGRAIQDNIALPQEPLQEGVLNFEYFMRQQHRDAAQHIIQDGGHFGLESVGAVLAVEQTEIVCNPCSGVACLATGDFGLVELVPEIV